MANPTLAHVLIVEDDSELLEVLKFVLEDGGYRVSVASTRAQALQMIGSEAVDLVVLDVNLNGVSGLDFARDVRAGAGATRPRIALHTGQEEDSIRREFSDYDLFIPKGDDANALLKSIAGVLADRGDPPPQAD